MRNRIKSVVGKVAKPLAKIYFSKPRSYSFKDLKGKVLPEVFHPQFTISTKFLMQFLETQDLQEQSFLELGCGTGFISVLAAQQGANVLSTDINPEALKNTILNAKLNKVELKTVKSDLFESISIQQFDYIIINPPYYPKEPTSVAEQAWFCGADFEYFQQLFTQLGSYMTEKSKVYMILSEDCDLKTIESIANKNQLYFNVLKEQKKMGEWTTIYQIIREIPFQ